MWAWHGRLPRMDDTATVGTPPAPPALAEPTGAVPTDRRVRHVVLTPKGERVRAELLDEFHTPPAELLGLSRKELEALARGLGKL